MAIQTFGVTAAKVRAHHFPQISEFSANSNPTSSTVGEMIEEAAAELAGALRREGLSATTLAEDDGSANPEAYAWCAATIRLGAAARTIQSMTGQDPEVAKAWEKRYRDRLKALDGGGAEVLGDAGLPVQASNGPRTHITSLGLEVPDDEPSELGPTFRIDDQL